MQPTNRGVVVEMISELHDPLNARGGPVNGETSGEQEWKSATCVLKEC
jgi:hypothetical protein